MISPDHAPRTATFEILPPLPQRNLPAGGPLRKDERTATAYDQSKMTIRDRADRLLVARGLFESRARAQAAIAAGRVTADGTVVRKASEEISSTAVIAAEPEHPYVSRGGVKLAAALDQFSLDVVDRICLDVGASTGGFTQVLLERGAQRVYAVDVGREQLHAQLRGHERILSIERTDIRKLDPARLAMPVDFVVVDVSFISLKLVLPHLDRLIGPRATILALIKPQFEADRRNIKKGIVRDAAVHAAICDDIAAFMTTLGWRPGRLMESPILGGDGNREFFIEAARG
jgi:23S rRNA (cytidine1920-2'-O)/16S rRNA (cytidine1409-2'-O)-methyltransferase